MPLTSKDMPSLDAQDAPWTEAEARVREALLSHDVPAPEGLEAAVFERLDGTPTQVESSGGRRVAALALAGAVVAAAWMWTQDGVDESPAKASAPVEVTAPAPMGTEPVNESAAAVAPEENDGTVSVTTTTEKASVSDMSMSTEPLESLTELEVSELEGGNEGERLPLKTDAVAPATQRLEATLEVKQ